jgi:hypothetical protein
MKLDQAESARLNIGSASERCDLFAGGRMVRRVIVSLMLAVILTAGYGCDSSDSEAPSAPAPAVPSMPPAVATKEAGAVSDAWLKLIDDGKYNDAWDQTGKWFQNSTSKDAFAKQTAAIRTAMGPLISRKTTKSDYTTKIPEGPNGDYVIMHYDTAFKATSDGMEEVTLEHEKDGTWKPLGYYLAIKPAPKGKSTP